MRSRVGRCGCRMDGERVGVERRRFCKEESDIFLCQPSKFSGKVTESCQFSIRRKTRVDTRKGYIDINDLAKQNLKGQ